MRLRRATLFGFIGSAFIATSAIAADVPPLVIAPTAPPPPIAASFDWAGPYVGAYGGAFFELDPISREFWVFGGQAGFNIRFGGATLAGVELRAGLIDDGGVVFEAALSGRLGVVLGDKVLLYGEAGVWFVAPSVFLWTAGGGVEVGLSNSVSLFVEAAVVGPFGGCCGLLITGGINFHPGN